MASLQPLHVIPKVSSDTDLKQTLRFGPPLTGPQGLCCLSSCWPALSSGPLRILDLEKPQSPYPPFSVATAPIPPTWPQDLCSVE